MTIVVVGLKVTRLGSYFETWSVGPRSSVEDSFLVRFASALLLLRQACSIDCSFRVLIGVHIVTYQRVVSAHVTCVKAGIPRRVCRTYNIVAMFGESASVSVSVSASWNASITQQDNFHTRILFVLC